MATTKSASKPAARKPAAKKTARKAAAKKTTKAAAKKTVRKTAAKKTATKKTAATAAARKTTRTAAPATAPARKASARRASTAKKASRRRGGGITPEQALANTRALLEAKQEHDRQPQPWQALDPGQSHVAQAGFQSDDARQKNLELHSGESRKDALQGSIGTQDRHAQGKRDSRPGT